VVSIRVGCLFVCIDLKIIGVSAYGARRQLQGYLFDLREIADGYGWNIAV